MSASTCPLCRLPECADIASLGPSVQIFKCGQCGVNFARYANCMPTTSVERDHFRDIDFEKYENSVLTIRKSSYDKLFRRVTSCVKNGRWLDVGCSYGCLLSSAEKLGFEGFGVEPSPSAAMSARESGLQVVIGCYPRIVGTGAPYDVISFMDVLEHLPDPREVLLKTKELLNPEGVVVIQVPDQLCLLYQLAKWMCQVSFGRLDFAFRRLWLTELDFPHRFYFGIRSLFLLLSTCGYQVMDCYRSAIGSPRHAMERVGYVGQEKNMALPLIGLSVALINSIDRIFGHGGLLTVIAKVEK